MSLEHEQATQIQTELQKIPRFRVVMINDDYTPMEFVEAVLQGVFGMPLDVAQRVTMDIHEKGKGICGVFSHEIAEAKVCKVAAIASQYEHPLLCDMEPAD